MTVSIHDNMVTNDEVLVKYKTSERKQLRVMIPTEIYEDIMDNIPFEWRTDPARMAMEVTRRLLIAKECEEK
jgi:hypothetical protein